MKDKRIITKLSAFVGAVIGLLSYMFFVLWDFGFENLDFRESLWIGLLFGSVLFALNVFFGIIKGDSLLKKLLAIPGGLVVGLIGFMVGAAIETLWQPMGPAIFAVMGVGILLGVALFGSIGNWIEIWIHDGFRNVLFRTIGFVSGCIGALIMVLTNPGLELVFSIIFGGSMFALFGLWVGAVVDLMRKKKDLDMKTSDKKKMVALFLCIFLGILGAHQFYVRRIGMGVLYIFTGGIFYIGWLIDIIKIAAAHSKII